MGLALVLLASLAGDWDRLPPLPDREGFAGAYAGTSRGALIVAGGANFPGKKPWEGGVKSWHEDIFLLERDGEWKVVGKLPRPLGYGVAVSHRERVVCVGGGDPERHHAAAFRLEWANGRIVTNDLPPLPTPLANACGALVGDTLYVAGGTTKPDATQAETAAWRIDLAAERPSWTALPPCPGPGRMLAVAASCDGAFWVVGGVELIDGPDGKPTRRYLKDAYRHDPDIGWTRVADLPKPLAAGPSPAPGDARGLFVLGGDDGSQVATPPAEHRGFDATIRRFDLRSGAWSDAGTIPAPRVTTPSVRWADRWIVPAGEARPGVRSPEVWAWTP